jgi:predicted DNA-binding transcriptional regulator AlpA
MSEVFDKLIGIQRVMTISGLSRKTIDRRERAGEFPRRIKDGEGRFARVFWSQCEVLDWVAKRKADRPALARTTHELLALAHEPKRRPVRDARGLRALPHRAPVGCYHKIANTDAEPAR